MIVLDIQASALSDFLAFLTQESGPMGALYFLRGAAVGTAWLLFSCWLNLSGANLNDFAWPVGWIIWMLFMQKSTRQRGESRKAKIKTGGKCWLQSIPWQQNKNIQENTNR